MTHNGAWDCGEWFLNIAVDPAQLPPQIPGVISTTVPDSENKVYLGGLPTHLTEMQVGLPSA